MSPSPDRPLNDVERDRMDAILSRFHSEDAMHNAEEVDGFFAALICSPEIAMPNEYLAEIWGEMADDEAFDEQELQDFLSLLMRHWNSIGRKLEEDEEIEMARIKLVTEPLEHLLVRRTGIPSIQANRYFVLGSREGSC
jgi:uncharacterized protein YecA (UPF0149 family)